MSDRLADTDQGVARYVTLVCDAGPECIGALVGRGSSAGVVELRPSMGLFAGLTAAANGDDLSGSQREFIRYLHDGTLSHHSRFVIRVTVRQVKTLVSATTPIPRRCDAMVRQLAHYTAWSGRSHRVLIRFSQLATRARIADLLAVEADASFLASGRLAELMPDVRWVASGEPGCAFEIKPKWGSLPPDVGVRLPGVDAAVQWLPDEKKRQCRYSLMLAFKDEARKAPPACAGRGESDVTATAPAPLRPLLPTSQRPGPTCECHAKAEPATLAANAYCPLRYFGHADAACVEQRAVHRIAALRALRRRPENNFRALFDDSSVPAETIAAEAWHALEVVHATPHMDDLCHELRRCQMLGGVTHDDSDQKVAPCHGTASVLDVAQLAQCVAAVSSGSTPVIIPAQGSDTLACPFDIRTAIPNFYAAISARDASIVVAVSRVPLERTAAQRAEAWIDGRQASYGVAAERHFMGGVEFSLWLPPDLGGSSWRARLSIIDLDDKSHKPLSWYVDRDASILEAYRRSEQKSHRIDHQTIP